MPGCVVLSACFFIEIRAFHLSLTHIHTPFSLTHKLQSVCVCTILIFDTSHLSSSPFSLQLCCAKNPHPTNPPSMHKFLTNSHS
ncbi:hypothetical protein QVD17_35479 [Tagetes erecta]|uniref:Secreted protein n=1 Tax=Tagetes erecta TaxID=13708 RepID=A0AAD8NM17_TARER|nr:hypothetical protein QVD17_35479 [Tagetes erecta]